MTDPTPNARKRAARAYAAQNGVKYTEALRRVAQGSTTESSAAAQRWLLDRIRVPWGTQPDCGPDFQDWGVEYIVGESGCGKTVFAVDKVVRGALGGVTQIVLDTESHRGVSQWPARIEASLAAVGYEAAAVRVVHADDVASTALDAGDVMIVPAPESLAADEAAALLDAAGTLLSTDVVGPTALTLTRETPLLTDGASAVVRERLERNSRRDWMLLRRCSSPARAVREPLTATTVHLGASRETRGAPAVGDEGLRATLSRLGTGEFLTSQPDGTFDANPWRPAPHLLDSVDVEQGSVPARDQTDSGNGSGQAFAGEVFADPTQISSWNVGVAIPSERMGVEFIVGQPGCGKSLFAYHRVALDLADGLTQVVLDTEGQMEHTGDRFAANAGQLGLDPDKVRVVSAEALGDVVLDEGDLVIVKVPWKTGLTADLLRAAATVLANVPTADVKVLTITSVSSALWSPHATTAEAETGVVLQRLETVSQSTLLLLRLVTSDSAAPLPITGRVVEWRGRSQEARWRDQPVGSFVLARGAIYPGERTQMHADWALVRALTDHTSR